MTDPSAEPSAEALSVPEPVARQQGNLRRGVEEKSPEQSALPWKLIVRNRLNGRQITKAFPLAFRNEEGEAETLWVNSSEQSEALPSRLRRRMITITVPGYEEVEFAVHSWKGLKVVRLFPQRVLRLHFRGDAVVESSFEVVVRLGSKTRQLGRVQAGGELKVPLKRARSARVLLYPRVPAAAVQPVSEVEFNLRLDGDTEREFDLTPLAQAPRQKLRLQLTWQGKDLDPANLDSSVFASSASGKPVEGVLDRRIPSEAWSGESAERRELVLREIPPGTYTFAMASKGFEQTFIVWPEGEREHLEEIQLPRLSHVTFHPANFEPGSPEVYGLRKGELWFGDLAHEGSAALLRQLEESSSRLPLLKSARNRGVARRALWTEADDWKISYVPNRTLWVAYESFGKWSVEPLKVTLFPGPTQVELEIVSKP